MSHDHGGSSADSSNKPRLLVVAGLIRAPHTHQHAGKILMSKRKADVHLAHAWEFPGGKVELGEHPIAALKRELLEELNIHVDHPHIYAIGHHCYATKEIILMVYECTYAHGEIQALGVAEFTWLSKEEVCRLPLPPADVEVIERLRKECQAEG